MIRAHVLVRALERDLNSPKITMPRTQAERLVASIQEMEALHRGILRFDSVRLYKALQNLANLAPDADPAQREAARQHALEVLDDRKAPPITELQLLTLDTVQAIEALIVSAKPGRGERSTVDAVEVHALEVYAREFRRLGVVPIGPNEVTPQFAKLHAEARPC